MTTLDTTPHEDTLFDRIRDRAENAFEYVGGITDLAIQTIQQIQPVERSLLTAQLDQIGVRSISIVLITSAFIGMVLALQTAYALEDFGGAAAIEEQVGILTPIDPR